MLKETLIKNIYEHLIDAVSNIKMKPSYANLNELKEQLNYLFEDSKCLGIIYTDNMDKMFFGTYIMPQMRSDDIIKMITSKKKIRVKEYYIELDSKLFGEEFRLDNKEITGFIVHNVSQLVSDTSACEKVIKALDEYLVHNKQTLRLSSLIHYKEILSYGFRDALRKYTNIFEKGNYEEDTLGEILPVNMYKNAIKNGLLKLNQMGQLFFNRETKDKFITFSWILRIYNDVVGYRIYANKLCDKMIAISPSQIEKKELSNMVKRINRIDDDMLLESSIMSDPLYNEIINEEFESNVYDSDKCFNKLHDDLIHIEMRSKDMETDKDSRDLLPELIHNINTRMTMLSDYASKNTMTKQEFRQWNSIYKDLAKHRMHLTNSRFYVPERKMVNTYRSSESQ